MLKFKKNNSEAKRLISEDRFCSNQITILLYAFSCFRINTKFTPTDIRICAPLGITVRCLHYIFAHTSATWLVLGIIKCFRQIHKLLSLDLTLTQVVSLTSPHFIPYWHFNTVPSPMSEFFKSPLLRRFPDFYDDVSILSFRRVLYVVCLLLGISPASEV